MKTSVDIRLAESVVFLRAGDATGRFRNPVGEPPAMLRGILVLNLAKATKITSIEVQLMCKASTAWPEGVGARRIDIQEEHKIYSQSYVYFDANATSSATSHRRTLSVGPGIAFDLDHDDEDRSDESSSDNHDARRTSRTSQSQSRDEPEWERRGRGLIRTNTRGRLPQRHLSVDQMNHQTEYVAHHDTHLPTPPYSPRDSPSLTPVRSLSRRTSFSLHRSPMDTVEELQETNATGIEDLPNVLQGNLHLDSESSLPPSRNSLQLPVTAGLQTPPYQPEHPPSIPSSIEHSGEFVLGNSSGTVYSNPYNHTTISIPNGYFPSSPSRATSTRATSPTAEDAHSRGRKSKRFNFANVSTAFFDAVKDRVRSVSHNERDRDVGSMRARERDRLEGHRDVTTITSARDMTPIRDMPPLREMTPLRDATPGRSHTRDSSRGRRRSPDRRRVSIAETIEQPHKSAILERVGEVLGLDIDDKKPHGDGWKEFKSGVYTYPISFAIPVTSSPSMSCEYGSVVWRLKAVVHRPGTFKSKLSASQEVTVVACPGEDDTEDTESIIVERQWDDQMQYLISISGRSFFIGGTIPINLTFAPWTKMKVYKLSLVIEERVEYLTQFKRVARTDSVNRIPLLSLTPASKENYLLPLSMDDPDALKNSPLNQLFQDDDDLSEIASSYMGPGPWHIETEVQLPKSCTQLHFTNKNKKSNILVTHMLKVIFRVQRGDDRDLDPVTGRRKMYDIVVQTPIHILSCLCSPLYTALPPYSGDLGVMSDGPRCRCNRTNRLLSTLPSPLSPPSAGVHAPLNTPATPISANPSSQSPHAYRWPLGRHSSSQSAESTSSTEHPSGHNSPLTLSRQNSTYNRFERLVTGQETEFGEAPPAYETVVAS